MANLKDYDVKRLFTDEGFENGFLVNRIMNGPDGYIPIGEWTYPTKKADPSWILIQWYSVHCLINERKDTGNPYEITDVENSKRVVYNPEEKSLKMSLNAKNCFKGKSKLEHFWPHLLIEQRHICDYKNMTDYEEKKFYSTEADKIFVEMDLRLTEYDPTTNPEDLDVCQFVAYVYLQLVDGNHIYIGFNPFDSRGMQEFFWMQEAGGDNFVYSLSTETVFGSKEKSFHKGDKINVSEEWKHIEVDLTPHIDNIIETANRDNIFGRHVSREDFYFSGTNVGFETHANTNCTFEIKNYNLITCFRKKK